MHMGAKSRQAQEGALYNATSTMQLFAKQTGTASLQKFLFRVKHMSTACSATVDYAQGHMQRVVSIICCDASYLLPARMCVPAFLVPSPSKNIFFFVIATLQGLCLFLFQK
eukprot:1158760-Pelagomonas_calceolata.AAC.4